MNDNKFNAFSLKQIKMNDVVVNHILTSDRSCTLCSYILTVPQMIQVVKCKNHNYDCFQIIVKKVKKKLIEHSNVYCINRASNQCQTDNGTPRYSESRRKVQAPSPASTEGVPCRLTGRGWSRPTEHPPSWRER